MRGIVPLAQDNRLEIGRGPHLGHDADGPVVADFADRDGASGADSGDLHAFHGLRAEVFRSDIALRFSKTFLKNIVDAAGASGGERRRQGCPVRGVNENGVGREHHAGPTASRGRHGAFPRRLVSQVQGVGGARHRILKEDKMRSVGSGKVAECRQRSVLPRAALGIAGGGSAAALRDVSAIGERLHGFVGDGGGVGRTRYHAAGTCHAPKATAVTGPARSCLTGGAIGHVPLPLSWARAQTGRCQIQKSKYVSWLECSPFRSHFENYGCRRIACTDPSARLRFASKLTPSGTAPGGNIASAGMAI